MQQYALLRVFSHNIKQAMSYHIMECYVTTCRTVVWEKFMVRNIREKKIRGKILSSLQAIDEIFLTPNISYRHILTCTLNYHLLFFLS